MESSADEKDRGNQQVTLVVRLAPNHAPSNPISDKLFVYRDGQFKKFGRK